MEFEWGLVLWMSACMLVMGLMIMGIVALAWWLSGDPIGPWLTEYRCAACSHVVSDHTVMYSDGRCPYCAHKRGNSTVMDTTEHAYRWIRIDPWWKFWRLAKREYHVDSDISEAERNPLV